MLSKNLDVVVITVTHLKDDDFISIGDITPAGYSLERVPRQKKRSLWC